MKPLTGKAAAAATEATRPGAGSGGGSAVGGGGGVRRRRKATRPNRRLTRRAVVKMLAVMESPPDANHDPVQDFLSSGRTGRRNAMPDILGEHASTSTAELPAHLHRLSTGSAPPHNAHPTAHGSECTGSESSVSGGGGVDSAEGVTGAGGSAAGISTPSPSS